MSENAEREAPVNVTFTVDEVEWLLWDLRYPDKQHAAEAHALSRKLRAALDADGNDSANKEQP